MVQVKINGSNISHYEQIGYEIPRYYNENKRGWFVKIGTYIYVSTRDIPNGSHTKVDVSCDYCGVVFKKSYNKLLLQRKKSLTKKDCCSKCIYKKTTESFQNTYGVDHNTQLEFVKQNISKKTREDENIVNDAFLRCDYIKLEDYINRKTPIKFICKKHYDKGIQETTYAVVRQYSSGCKYCRYEKISGENQHNWKGGISDLSSHLRSKTYFWKVDSFEHYGYKCVLTNLGIDIELHHTYSFSSMINDTLKELNIPVFECVNKYSDKELELIENKCTELHYKFGYGVPLNMEIHKLFHKIYGKHNNTPEQFEEFKSRFLNGEFERAGDTSAAS